jgi:hypothetical protein
VISCHEFEANTAKLNISSRVSSADTVRIHHSERVKLLCGPRTEMNFIAHFDV